MRDYAVQQMRVSAMIFIVLYHCVCFYGIWHIQDSVKYENIEYWRSACYFALNAFVFISGLLYAKLYSAKEKYRNRKGLLKDKVNRLLFPYFFWSIVALLLFPSTEPIKMFLCGSHHLWFLLMLMGVFLIISIMGDKVLSDRFLAGGVFTLLILNGLVGKYGSSIPGYLAWKETLRYLPAFFVGALTARLRIPELFSKMPKQVLLICTLLSLLLVITVTLSTSLPLGVLYMNLPTYFLLICIYSILALYPIKRSGKVMNNLDKNSMGIYIIHHLLIWVALIYFPIIQDFMIHHTIAGPIFLFFIVFTISWLLAHIFTKHRYTRFLFNFNQLNPI